MQHVICGLTSGASLFSILGGWRVKQTDQTLLEQMRITAFDIEHRKRLFSLTDEDVQALVNARPLVEREIDALVAQFYEMQTSVPEIALVIGDADTLNRLRSAQSQYVIDLFSGFYDMEYVNNRLRIGVVHKRIGVEPRLYLAAVVTLKTLLIDLLHQVVEDESERLRVVSALEKLFMFDVALVFETYIRSLVSEIEIAKAKSDQYAYDLEEKVRERTMQLEILSRTDPVTGLLNMRHLSEVLRQALRAAQRRAEPITVVYFDIDDLKLINDTHGHLRGDEVIRAVANAIKSISRVDDHCFRYGGDEFCVIMSNCTRAQAENIYGRRLIEEIGKHEKELSISIGYAQTGPVEYVSPEALIRQADKKMYAAKTEHKTRKRGSEA